MNIGTLAPQAPQTARVNQERPPIAPVKIDETVKVLSIDMAKAPQPIGWDTGEVDAKIAESMRIMKQVLSEVAGWNGLSSEESQRAVEEYAAAQERAERLER